QTHVTTTGHGERAEICKIPRREKRHIYISMAKAKKQFDNAAQYTYNPHNCRGHQNVLLVRSCLLELLLRFLWRGSTVCSSDSREAAGFGLASSCALRTGKTSNWQDGSPLPFSLIAGTLFLRAGI